MVLTLTNNYPEVQSLALAYAGRIHADLTHDQTVNTYYAKARKLAEVSENKKLLAVVCYQEGSSQLDSKVQESMIWLEKGMQISEQHGFKQLTVMFLCNIGYAYKKMQEMRKSNSCYEKSLQISKEIESRYNIALSYHNLGSNYQEMTEHATAKKHYTAALHIYQQIFQRNHGHIIKVQRGLRQVEANLERN